MFEVIILELNNSERCILLVGEGTLELKTVDAFEPEVTWTELVHFRI